jgi:hypothetical protein
MTIAMHACKAPAEEVRVSSPLCMAPKSVHMQCHRELSTSAHLSTWGAFLTAQQLRLRCFPSRLKPCKGYVTLAISFTQW